VKTSLLVHTAFEVLETISKNLGEVFSCLSQEKKKAMKEKRLEEKEEEEEEEEEVISSSLLSSASFLTKEESFIVNLLKSFSVDSNSNKTLLDDLLEKLFDVGVCAGLNQEGQRTLHAW
jgi:hypothetical protein